MKFTAFLPSLLAASSVAIATTLPATAATLVTGSTDTYQFENTLPTGDSNLSGDSFADAFRFRVTSSSEGTVLFRFLVAPTSGVNYFVSQIYFNYFNPDATSPLLSDPVIGVNNVGIVNFQETSGNLSQGDDPGVGFLAENTFFSAGVNTSNTGNRLSGGETLGIRFTGELAAVLAALESNTLRIGLNVQGFPDGSDSFVSGSSPVVEEPVVEEPVV
ncbi:MAG: hypothetical protein WBA43_10690, partial [Elainellaceae cyanobacterium]